MTLTIQEKTHTPKEFLKAFFRACVECRTLDPKGATITGVAILESLGYSPGDIKEMGNVVIDELADEYQEKKAQGFFL